MKNVLQWLEDKAQICSDKIAYEDEESRVTFFEVCDASKRIGSAVRNRNPNNAPVAIIMSKGVVTIEAYLGVVYSGRAYAPIDASLPDTRISTILKSLRPSLIITENRWLSKVEGCKKQAEDLVTSIVVISDLIHEDIDEVNLANVRRYMAETDPLYVIYTSGSSGVPKGVMTSHHSLMCYIESYCEVMGITDKDVLGNQAPLDYIAAIRDIYIPIYKGASSVLIPKEYFMQPEKLREMMNAKMISSVGWSTSALTVLTTLGIHEEGSLKYLNKVCFSGSIMSAKVLKTWQEHLPKALFVNQYGPTEVTASCTYYVVDHIVEEGEDIPIGKPYNNYRVYLIDDLGEATPPGELGEICVGGPTLALGYYHDMERTHKDFVQNPLNDAFVEYIYKTGDIGRVREDGNLEFHGRRDRQVKHMGHRIELDEIEITAMNNPSIEACSVVYDFEKEVIGLFYEGDIDKKDVVLMLRKVLPGFMIPRKVHQMENLPKLPNGKINMNILKEML